MKQQDEMFSIKTAKLLTNERKKAGLSQRQLALKLGISKSTIGKREIVGLKNISSLTTHLRVLNCDPHIKLKEIIED